MNQKKYQNIVKREKVSVSSMALTIVRNISQVFQLRIEGSTWFVRELYFEKKKSPRTRRYDVIISKTCPKFGEGVIYLSGVSLKVCNLMPYYGSEIWICSGRGHEKLLGDRVPILTLGQCIFLIFTQNNFTYFLLGVVFIIITRLRTILTPLSHTVSEWVLIALWNINAFILILKYS